MHRRWVVGCALLLVAFPADAGVERVFGWGRCRGVGTEISIDPYGLSISGGALFIADSKGNAVCRQDLATGQSTLIAGSLPFGLAGDGGSAATARLHTPLDVAVGSDGTVYFSDSFNGRVRAVSPDGVIRSIAAGLNLPAGLSIGPDGRLYIADVQNSRIVRIGPLPCADVTSCPVEVYAGTGLAGFSGDGQDRLVAQFRRPFDVLWSQGVLYVADTDNNRIRTIAASGTVSTVAGNGNATFGPLGDGGPALTARLNAPQQIAVAPDGTLYIAETGGNRVRAVAPDTTITTVIGTGSENLQLNFSTDPLGLSITQPTGVAVVSGRLYVSSEADRAIYALTLDTETPTVTRVATLTSSPTSTATLSPTITASATATSTGTASPISPATATMTATATTTATATVSASATRVATVTSTPTLTPTFTPAVTVLVCDVTNNGAVTSLDAARVLQTVAGMRTLTDAQRAAADATGDGTVSALDATRILQWAAEVRPPLGPTSRCGTTATVPPPG